MRRYLVTVELETRWGTGEAPERAALELLAESAIGAQLLAAALLSTSQVFRRVCDVTEAK